MIKNPVKPPILISICCCCQLDTLKIAYKTLEPSIGGMGIKLKIPKNMFSITMGTISSASSTWPKDTSVRTLKAANTARIKLVATPPIATANNPNLGFLLKFAGLYGTGFAHPKIKPPNKSPIRGKRIDPIGSMCGIGFKVKRPALFAVSSPKNKAATPCAISCKIIETIKMTSTKMIPKTEFIYGSPSYFNVLYKTLAYSLLQHKKRFNKLTTF